MTPALLRLSVFLTLIPFLAFTQAIQSAMGHRNGITITASFDGLGEGFEGPHGTAWLRNPSDNSLAVGHDHIVQVVNT
ncbi:MAG: hypothetical protein ACKOAR_07175, partial [Bacteroidota bacterium]